MDIRMKEEIEAAIGDKIPDAEFCGSIVTTASGKEYFLKGGARSPAYRCEANGLKELAKAKVIPVAKVAAVGDNYILTEYIGRGTPGKDFHSEFGRRLAYLHRFRGKQFGFHEDNFIGATPQVNIPSAEEKDNWTTFYFNKRLMYQYRLAERNGNVSSPLKKGFKRLEHSIEGILAGSAEEPSLLHGDLWSGNYLCTRTGDAALIDPAVYYGHREADLAMTKLFGGFPEDFYRAYREEYPLKDGWERREGIYKLYHILNHLNMFGRGYLAEAEYILSRV